MMPSHFTKVWPVAHSWPILKLLLAAPKATTFCHIIFTDLFLGQSCTKPRQSCASIESQTWKSVNNFLSTYWTELFLGPLQSPDRPVPIGIQNTKTRPQLFANMPNGAHSWPVVKPRPTCTHWQSKHEKVSTTFCQGAKWSSFLARCEALDNLHPLAIKT